MISSRRDNGARRTARDRCIVALLIPVLTSITTACGTRPVPSGPTGPWRPGAILFLGQVGGVSNVYAMRPDGSDERRLTNNQNPTIKQFGPVWSPDGAKIAFSAGVPGTGMGDIGTSNVYVMNADGSGLTQLVRSGWAPTWSPDGSMIAFVRVTVASNMVYLMNADGSDVQSLGPGTSPTWSPDGARIAFIGRAGGIKVIDASGSEQSPVQASSDVYALTWAPSNRQIAYTSRAGYPLTIYVEQLGASAPTSLGRGWAPAWSPNGRRIIFVCCDPGPHGIWVMNADGTQRMLLTRGLEESQDPIWSPDSNQIAFVSKGDIYVMGAGGAHLTDVSRHHPTDDGLIGPGN